MVVAEGNSRHVFQPHPVRMSIVVLTGFHYHISLNMPIRHGNSVNELSAREWHVHGRVQGVGFRWFVQQRAVEIGVAGWARNLDDGRVHVYAIGTPDQLNRLAGHLHMGPRMAEVRGLEERESGVQQLNSFRTE